MEFDYVVGWYSRKENQMKPLGGFMNIKSAKAYADMKDTVFFGEGFLYINSPEGKYINGYEKYSDNRPKWFSPEEVNNKSIRVYSSHEDRNVLLDDFMPYEDYKRFKENGKSSVLEKLSENRQKVDSANTYNEHQPKEHQNER